MDIRQVLRDLRQNLLVVLLAFAVCVAAGAAAAYLPAAQYQASTQLLLYPSSTDPAGGVQVIQYIILQLPTEATNSSTLTAVRDSLPQADAAAGVSVTAAAPPTTDVLTISVTADAPDVAAVYANAVAAYVEGLQPKNALYSIKDLSPALPPTSPSNPRKPVLVGTIGLGVIVAVFAGITAAGIRRRFSRVSELKDRIGATVLGEIPRVMSGNIRPTGLFVLGRQPMMMEAFQELRSNLLLSIPDGGPASIAVTSCDPSEGKTSVAANLAWALASESRPITAVDCDLRKPMLHLELEVPFGPGLASGTATDAVRHASRTTNPSLEVVPAGIPTQHPADVVSAYLPPLLHSLSERRQTVIVDCPPMIGVAETVLVAAMVDMVIVVVDTRRLHPERLQQCLLRLDGVGANVVGVVLNRTRRRRHAAGYHYGYYGQSDSALAPPVAPAGAGESAPTRSVRTRFLEVPSVDAPMPPVQPVRPPSPRNGGRDRSPVFRPKEAKDGAAPTDAPVPADEEHRRRQPGW